MKFVLFRHGHSLANQESRIVSSLENGTRTDGGPEGTGFGLSSKGRLEVAETAKSLADHIITTSTQTQNRATVRILTSPFQRTLNTASIIKSQFRTSFSPLQDTITLELGLTITQDLRERFFGEFEMRTPSEDLYNQVWAADAQNPFHELFGVESVVDVTRRVTGVIRSQEERREEQQEQQEQQEGEEVWVVLVSHGDSLQILQTAMRGWSGDRHRQLDHLETANWRVVEWCPGLQAAHQSHSSRS
ncbi:hypothetical protein BGX30_014020 [Mortierella sp. GBA39]|nr:hypothetical protein BGX30_014020 [Mortierella sp. GBA39]